MDVWKVDKKAAQKVAQNAGMAGQKAEKMVASMAASTVWRKVETLVVAKVVTMEK